jgi:hypothetical protein
LGEPAIFLRCFISVLLPTWEKKEADGFVADPSAGLLLLEMMLFY